MHKRENGVKRALNASGMVTRDEQERWEKGILAQRGSDD